MVALGIPNSHRHEKCPIEKERAPRDDETCPVRYDVASRTTIKAFCRNTRSIKNRYAARSSVGSIKGRPSASRHRCAGTGRLESDTVTQRQRDPTRSRLVWYLLYYGICW